MNTPCLIKRQSFYFKYLKDIDEMPTEEKRERMQEAKWFMGSMEKEWFNDVARFANILFYFLFGISELEL